MQTILVPIDFTAASENALVYANKLAVRLPAEIVLVQAGTGAALAPTERIERLARLQALAERLRYQQLTRHNGRRIHYHFHLAAEPLAEVLQLLVQGYSATYVVAGLALTDCAAAAAADTPPGLLPGQVSCPVLLVPPGHHELPGRVVISGDFGRFNASQLAALPGLTRLPGAQFSLVQFYQPSSAGLAPLKKSLLDARAHLPGAATHLLPEEDALEGISEFCAEHTAQLLAEYLRSAE